MNSLLENVKSFPKSPGVYLMKNAKGEILYIGKATSLKSRVLNYFGKENDSRYQIRFLMSKVHQIDTLLTQNNKEALLLENTLIKKHRPRYNINLKDDKNYVRLKLSVQDAAPRLYITRKTKKDGSLYFGPYTSAHSCREVVSVLQKYFKLRNCSDREYSNRSRPCLQYQIKRCDAPCVGLISIEDYRKKVEQVRLFLEGRNEELKQKILEEMNQAAQQERFEDAAHYRDLQQAVEITLEKQKVVGESKNNQDFIGFHREKLKTSLVVLMVREGNLQEKKEFFLDAYETDEDLIQDFLLQYYESAALSTQEIFLPLKLEDNASLEAILSERAGHRIRISSPERGEKNQFIAMAQSNAKQALGQHLDTEHVEMQVLKKLQSRLQLKALPWRIECFDISHFQGKQTVASMVTFIGGKPEKSLYRRFHIRSVDDTNDFASLYEVVSRRLKNYFQNREDENSPWQLPDLMVIDGGKGQLNAALQALKDSDISELDCIALAKSRSLKDHQSMDDFIEDFPETIETLVPSPAKSPERVFLPNRKNPVIFSQQDRALHLLMRARDEAHRFGIQFHRQTREKYTLKPESFSQN